MLLVSLLLGALVGFIMALTGAGGSVIAVPFLVLGLHLPVAQAAPIGLMAVLLAASTGAALGLRAGFVRYRAALLMAALGLLCAPAGLLLAHRLPNAMLSILFCVVLVYVANRMWRLARQGTNAIWEGELQLAACKVDPQHGRFLWTAPCARRLMLSGAAAGFLSGLLGVGGGFVLVPALHAVSSLNMKSIVATALATIAVIAGGSILFAAYQQGLDWRIALPFALASVVGMLAGQKIADRSQGPLMQRVLAVLAMGVAVGMAIKPLLQ